MKWKILYLMSFMLALAACTAGSEPLVERVEPAIAEPTVVVVAEPTIIPTPIPPTEEPTAETAPEPTAVLLPTPEPEPTIVEEVVAEAETAVNVIAGRTDEGAFFLGDPNAPLTMIDYSDFL